jgi:hypothetical protein
MGRAETGSERGVMQEKGWRSVGLSCFCALAVMSKALGQECKGCTTGKVNIPITLAVGTVRTPVFTTRGSTYLIAILFRRSSLSYEGLKCKIGDSGLAENANELSSKCKEQPLIEAKWRVLDGDQEISHGKDEGFSEHFELDNKVIRRYIGDFHCESNHKYVVEVTFAKDGSSLNFANPHLAIFPPEGSF